MKRFVINMYDDSTDYNNAQKIWDESCDADYTKYKLLNAYGFCMMEGDTTHDNIYSKIMDFLTDAKGYYPNEEIVIDCYVIFEDEVTVKVEM